MALKRNDPATLVARLRINHKDLATLADYFVQEGLEPTSIGGLLRSSLEMLATNLRYHSSAKTFNFSEAVNYLQKLGLIKSSPEDLNRATFMKEMQREALEADGFSTSYVDGKSMTKATELLAKNLQKKKREQGGAVLGATPGEVKDGIKREGNSEADGEDG